MEPLRAAVVIDYQNVHLTGVNLFKKGLPLHEYLVHPLRFATKLIEQRNATQKQGFPPAVLTKVLVFRGLPSATYDAGPYGRNLAQKSAWERDPRVEVTHRSLKNKVARNGDGAKVKDESGDYIIESKQEKGIDVLCALALVQQASRNDIDLVILCSQDTDLEPALDMVLTERSAQVETFAWFDPKQFWSKSIRPSKGNIWNTRMDQAAFSASCDPNLYP